MASDVELLAAIRGGDRTALDQLLEAHQAQLYRFGMRMCGNPDDAKDVVQETMIALARGAEDFEGRSSLSTWLYTVARSFCIKKRRRSRYAPTNFESFDDPEGSIREMTDQAPVPESAMAEKELGGHLKEAIDALEPSQREVLLLRDVEGLTAPEVAEALGLTIQAVKSRLHRARATVRQRVAPFLGEDAVPSASCPDIVALFSAHLEGDIGPDVCAQMEKHLETCPRCSVRCSSLRSVLTLCRTSPTPEVPAAVQTEIRRAVRMFAEERFR